MSCQKGVIAALKAVSFMAIYCFFLALASNSGCAALFTGGISTCIAESLAAKGSWSTACDGVYPNACGSGKDLLYCNDALSETHISRRSGSTYTYAGVRIKQYNTSITNCELITNVKLCYEWWGDGTKSDCSIMVDANGGASWSTVTTTCPGATANPGVTCTDVTALEAWNCQNFFTASGTRAEAKAELTTTNNNLDRTQYWGVFYFDVTYAIPGTELTLEWLDPDKEQVQETNLVNDVNAEEKPVSFVENLFNSIFSMFAK